MTFSKNAKRAVAVVGASMAAAASQAAVDTTNIVAEISSNETAITNVGVALLGLAVVAVGIKWIKGTIFS